MRARNESAPAAGDGRGAESADIARLHRKTTTATTAKPCRAPAKLIPLPTKARSAHVLLVDVADGAAAVADRIGRWRPFLPSLTELDAADAALVSLRRLLANLRPQCGGRDDAA